MPLHVLDCPGLPAHTCVWGRLPHNVSALANLLQEMPTKPSATSICSMTELLEAYTWLAPPITTRTWACDLAAGMSGNSVESTLNQICFKYASPKVIVLHTRLLMAKEHECQNTHDLFAISRIGTEYRIFTTNRCSWPHGVLVTPPAC